MPRIAAGSSFRKNPIVQAFLSKAASCEDLNPGKIHETSINEPLINWHSIDGELAFQAIIESNGWASNVSDKTMTHLSSYVKNQEGLSVLPASTAGLSALMDLNKQSVLPGDRYVVVLTGRK